MKKLVRLRESRTKRLTVTTVPVAGFDSHSDNKNKELKMKRKITLFIAAAALSGAALVAAVFGDTSSASPLHASKGALVALRSTPLGNVLVDARGRTLYLFAKDKQGRSACSGACATNWPPLFSTAKPRPGKGVHASLLGVTKRANGKRQVTYAGHPLYTFIADKKAGQTAGEGLTAFGAAWDVIAASGHAVEPSASDSGGNGGGYGGGYGGYGARR
jgi:predicted lipoprotein with Yx(FWY)xxD motif